MIGKTINQYKILEKLGAGGMGVVYKALDTKLDRHVALKFLPQHVSENEIEKKRFILEAKSASAIQHNNICTIYDIAETNEGQLFICMEYYNGETLKSIIERGPIPIAETIDIAKQVASGLSKAHNHGIVHRDIKPANIIVTDDGVVKIVDFGLAKLAGQTRLTKTGGTIGTIAYMSPEQGRGEEIDHRTDIWAWGVVLYEMLANELPFKGEYEQAIIYSILNQEPDPVHNYRSDIPAKLIHVLDRALVKDRKDRFQDIAQILEELDGTRQRLDTKDRDPSSKGSPSKRILSYSMIVIFMAISYLVISTIINRNNDTSSGGSLYDNNLIAVLPFAYENMGRGELSELADGIMGLLSRNFDGLGKLRSVESQAVLRSLSGAEENKIDPQFASAIAKDHHAALFVLGSLFEFDHEIRITASLYRQSRDGLVRLSQSERTGLPSEAPNLIDELSMDLVREGLDQGAANLLKPSSGVSTSSIAAFKYYSKGMNEYYRGRFSEAVEVLRMAVREDSLFALAWYRIAQITEGRMLRNDLAKESFEMAHRLHERLPLREKMMIRSQDAYLRGDARLALEIVSSLLDTYPNAVEAWGHKGAIISQFGHLHNIPLNEAVKAYEKASKFEPDNPHTLQQLSWLALESGNLDLFDSLRTRTLALSPDHPHMWLVSAAKPFIEGDSVGQKIVLSEANRKDDLSIIGAMINVLRLAEDFDGASKFAKMLMNASMPRLTQGIGYISLATFEAAQGRFRRADAILRQADKLVPSHVLEHRAVLDLVRSAIGISVNLKLRTQELQNWIPRDDTSVRGLFPGNEGVHRHIRLYLLGLICAKLGEVDKARSLADSLQNLEGPSHLGSLGFDLAQGVRAQAFFFEGKELPALESLESAKMNVEFPLFYSSPFHDRIHDRFNRARLLMQVGKVEESLRWFANIRKSSPMNSAYLAPSYLYRARIYEKLNDVSRAIAHKKRFIELWSDCDPELQPLVDEAKEELQMLKMKTSF